MPFPSHSFESLQDQSQQFHAETTMLSDEVDTDTTYWEAYVHHDDSKSASPVMVTDSDPQHAAEDSYWSQYAAIQGKYQSPQLRCVHSIFFCRLWGLYSSYPAFPRSEAK
jgi:hypothetical protein